MEFKAGKKIYEGKAKILYETADPDLLIQEFKDDATAFDATKRGVIHDKGIVNNRISAVLFRTLEDRGVATHFVRLLGDRTMLVRRLAIIPIEVTVRNVVAGGMARTFGLEEGKRLKQPVYEIHYKSDPLHDPLMNEEHAVAMGLAAPEELATLKERSLRVNRYLIEFFSPKGIDLIDFKLEYGRYKGRIFLGDEISPDTCRFWEVGTGRKLDKDRFRRDLGGIEEAYQEMLKRVES
ncbi:MAG: phosphoribosylaminoimidazolesuccinocarboxamide synthase [Candidatus Omnitrophica bacterium]|nr:phosphoribosylaminoimidazolesuccinocarboxamide synthase [Candidatus Omnitrophota bacterium]